MGMLPMITPAKKTQLVTYNFKGYNHNPVINDGEMYDMMNLSGDQYPLLSQRKGRCIEELPFNPEIESIIVAYFTFVNGSGEVQECVITRDREPYNGKYNFTIIDKYLGQFRHGVTLCQAHAAADGSCPEIKYVISGNLLFVYYEDYYPPEIEYLPDELVPKETIFDLHSRFTIYSSDVGDKNSSDTEIKVYKAIPCPQGGYSDSLPLIKSRTQPTHALPFVWQQETDDTCDTFWSYEESRTGYFISDYIEATLGKKLNIGDVVWFFGIKTSNSSSSGSTYDYNGKHIVMTEPIETEIGKYTCVLSTETPYYVGVDKQQFLTHANCCMFVPKIDQMCVSGNRLWCCHYGYYLPYNNPKTYNEIRCSALGDFSKWELFEGTNNDSWAASVGVEGAFTGMIPYEDGVFITKENYLMKVTGTMPSTYSIATNGGPGVQAGSSDSMKLMKNCIYYKGRDGVFRYDGTGSELISDQLPKERMMNAIAGVNDEKYYIQMENASGNKYLFEYDYRRSAWYREAPVDAKHFVVFDGELVAADYVDPSCIVTQMTGNPVYETPEGAFDWEATFGQSGYEFLDGMQGSFTNLPKQTYLSRYNIRMRLTEGSWVRMWIEYDSSGEWEDQGEIRYRPGMTTFMIPVIPRRCDHCRLKLTGHGRVDIYSIGREFEAGGDGGVL